MSAEGNERPSWDGRTNYYLLSSRPLCSLNEQSLQISANFSSGTHCSCNTGLISTRQIDVVHVALDNNSSVEFSTLDELSEDSDEKLFFLSRYNPNHVLHRLLPQPKNTGYNLRQRTHDLTLPTDISAVIKQNFVYRMLFRDIY